MTRSRFFAARCGLFLLGYLTTPAGAVNLADLSGWDIVIPSEPIESEIYAAEELQHFLAEATGCELPLRRKAEADERHFFVGQSDAMLASNVGFDTSMMGDEDLRILVRGENLAIAGGRPRGTLYGVYAFLEDYLGVRFLTPDHTHVPKITEEHPLDEIDYSYRPPLSFRWSNTARRTAIRRLPRGCGATRFPRTRNSAVLRPVA
ncbi:MAG: hypothetical protein GXY25_20695 [Pirellulaceae bacterium]|nr:hypothetical protein [Pirellulaceae bacterium]